MTASLRPSSLSWSEARAAFDAGELSAAELCAEYVAGRAERLASHRFRQAPRVPALACAPDAHPRVRLLAERELRGLPRAVGSAVVAWAHGERPVDLLFTIPTPRDVLALQARGRRCVSLLEEAPPPVKKRDTDAGLAFAVHDLCHLEKFMDPTHHDGQVGFFAALDRAMADARWADLERGFDAAWAESRDHVLADMNGSPAFLFVVLKSSIKLALRRRIARDRGEAQERRGPLDDDEARAYDAASEVYYELLDLPPSLRDAGRLLASRRDHDAEAAKLIEHFQAQGREARLRPCAPPPSSS